MNRPMLVAAIAWALAACAGGEYEAVLADVRIISVDLGDGELHLRHDGTAAPCPILSGVKVTVDGVELESYDLGGENKASWNHRSSCRWPSWNVPRLDARETSTIVLGDSSASLTVEVANLFTPKELRLASPATPTGRAGDQVELAWLPTTDRFLDEDGTTTKIQVWGASPFWLESNGGGVELTADNHLRFQLQKMEPESPEPTTLAVSATGYHTIRRCELAGLQWYRGSAECVSWFHGGAEIPFTILP